jgi:hypothetical protein
VKSGLDTLSLRQRALVESALARRRQASGAPAISHRSEAGPAPLSFSQQRIWFLEQWEPGAPTHNGVRVFRLRGPIDADLLGAAFALVVERHESLRTVIAVENREPVQIPLTEWSLELPTIDLSGTPDATRDAQLRELLRSLAREPFDLTRDLMIRTELVRLGPDDHVLVVRLHHIAFDAFSDRILFGEVNSAYASLREGKAPELPELPIQYADFALWQRERLRGETLSGLVEYWRDQLAGAPPLLRLPTDRPRRPVQRHEGAHLEFALPRKLAEDVVALARKEGVTVFMALEAAFATLLYRLTGMDDIVVGTPIANRNETELGGSIGFFSNTIVLRNRLGGNASFREVLRRTRETAVSAYVHQDLPFDKVVEALRLPRDPSYNPIFQVNFRAHAGDRLGPEFPGVEASPMFVDIGFSRFDLSLELQVQDDAITGYFEYDRDLFEPTTIEALVGDLETLLAGVLADPDLPILALPPPSAANPTRLRRAPSGPRRSR